MSVVTNRVSNPSFEAGTTGATAVPGTTGAAALTNPTVATPFGAKALHCQWSTASTAAGGGLYVEIDVAAAGLAVGDTISAGIFWALSSIANRLQMSVEFRTASATIGSPTMGAQQQVAAGASYGAAQPSDPAASWLKLESLVIPATCTKIRIRLLSVAGTGYANWSIGSYLRVDGVALVKAATLPSGVGWGSTLAAFYTPELTVTMLEDMAPSPRATVEVKDPFPDSDHLTVLQLSSEGQLEVRSAIDIDAAGGTFSTDFEVPPGVDVTYRAQFFTAADAQIGLSDPVTVSFELDPGWAIVQDYLIPENALKVRAESQFAGTLQRSRNSQTYRAGSATLALSGETGLLESIPLRLVTETDEDAAVLADILEGGTALIRTSGMGLPPLLYFLVSTWSQVQHNRRSGGQVVLWDMTGDEVSRDTLEIEVPTVTWQQVIDAYPTWADLIAAHPTWLDLIKNPPPQV